MRRKPKIALNMHISIDMISVIIFKTHDKVSIKEKNEDFQRTFHTGSFSTDFTY